MTEHKHAKILRAIADGKEVGYFRDGLWRHGNLYTLAKHEELVWRIKPETIMVNDMECPKPNNEGLFILDIHLSNTTNRKLHFKLYDDAMTVYNALIKPFNDEEKG